jgi:hypothetical protein
MLLYELKDPVVHKFGGVLTADEKRRCVRETVLSPTWAPYPVRAVEVESICGRLRNFWGADGWSGMSDRLRSVCHKSPSPFGAQTELYHLRGQLTARNAPGLEKAIGFKGVRGHAALRELIQDSLLPDETVGKVHMAVFSSFIGRRLQTSPGCYLEDKVEREMPWLSVVGRCMDQFNVVRLGVCDWDAVGLERRFRPRMNDLVLTARGSLMHRFTWNGAGNGLEWTQEAEEALCRACQRVSDAIGEAC